MGDKIVWAGNGRRVCCRPKAAFQKRLKPDVEAGGGNVLLWGAGQSLKIKYSYEYICVTEVTVRRCCFTGDVMSAFKICCKSKKMGCFSRGLCEAPDVGSKGRVINSCGHRHVLRQLGHSGWTWWERGGSVLNCQT